MATQNWLTAAGAAATTARESASYEPILLVDFPDLSLKFGTAAVSGQTVDLLLADIIRGGGLGAVSRTLDEAAYTPRMQGAALTLVNADNLAKTTNQDLFRNTIIDLYVGFASIAFADFLRIFRGTVDRYRITYGLLALSCIDRSLSYSINLSTPVGARYFPGAPQASRSIFIPILIGGMTNVPTIQVEGTAAGSLALLTGTTETTIFLKEYNATFPAAGTMTIEAESGVTYTGRRLINSFGKTYLELTGLTRGAPVSHAVGVAVTLTGVNYRYLIGYKIPTALALQTVRNNDVVVAPANYTLETVTADRDTSVLKFTTAQGTVTVDIGPSDTGNLLSNGGFETGTAANWTVANGGSVVVTTSSPLPTEGSYRAALTGRLNLYGDLYQEITTVAGQTYAYSLQYQTVQSGVITNGGFEDGTTTNWTITNNVRAVVVVQAHHLITANVEGLEGNYSCQVKGDETGGQFSVDLYHDVTTVVNTVYTLAFLYAIWKIIIASVGGGDGQITNSRTVAETHLSYAIGTTTDPEAVVPYTVLPFSHWIVNGAEQPSNALGIGAKRFTATATTTRITFRCSGTNRAVTSNIDRVWFLYLDHVRLITDVDDSGAALLIGTPADYDTYVNTVLATAAGWVRHSGTFVATTTTTRLTLQAKYSLNSLAAYYDDVRIIRVFDGLLNPVDAMVYILTTFMPDIPYSSASFITAHAVLKNWTFGALNAAPGDGMALLYRMASQCGTLLAPDSDGTLTLTVLDDSRTSQATFDIYNIVVVNGESTFEIESGPLDNVYSSIYVYFGTKTGGSTSPEDFSGVTYATTGSTTSLDHPELTLLCNDALDVYGRDHRLDVYADFIQDFATANRLLFWLVTRHTKRYDIVRFQTWADGLPRALGEKVRINHPRMPQRKPFWEGEIIGYTFLPQSMTVELEVRLLKSLQTGSLVWASPELVGDIDYLHETLSVAS